MRKARFPEAPTAVPHSGTCPICGAGLMRFTQGGAELITCPAIVAGAGFHEKPNLGPGGEVMDATSHLTSSHLDVCSDFACPESVKRDPVTGRWFITMWHPGFNTRANNAQGFGSKGQARRVMAQCAGVR